MIVVGFDFGILYRLEWNVKGECGVECLQIMYNDEDEYCL